MQKLRWKSFNNRTFLRKAILIYLILEKIQLRKIEDIYQQKFKN